MRQRHCPTRTCREGVPHCANELPEICYVTQRGSTALGAKERLPMGDHHFRWLEHAQEAVGRSVNVGRGGCAEHREVDGPISEKRRRGKPKRRLAGSILKVNPKDGRVSRGRQHVDKVRVWLTQLPIAGEVREAIAIRKDAAVWRT